MQPQYEILFSFSAAWGHLVEIKRLDQPANASKSQVFQWLWIEAETVTTLQFVSMDATDLNRRTFKEAALWFDNTHGQLQWDFGPSIDLQAQPNSEVPEALAHLVSQHLSRVHLDSALVVIEATP